jgi:Na+/proline symporter
MENKHLSIIDYIVILVSLLSVLGVGIWQALKNRGKPRGDLLIAEDGMSVFPVALSLVASYLSGILIIGK